MSRRLSEAPPAASGDSDGARARHGRLRSAIDRLVTSQDVVDAAEEQDRATSLGGTPCRTLTGRRRVTVAGSLRSVTLRPRAGVPALEAELFDGSGTVTMIWLGRREIAGIQCGRRLRAEGLVAVNDGRAVLYNPRYELLPGQGE